MNDGEDEVREKVGVELECNMCSCKACSNSECSCKGDSDVAVQLQGVQ